MSVGCLICKPKHFSLNRKYNIPAEELIIWEGDSINVAPDLFLIAVRPALVSSKKHYNSFANALISVINIVRGFVFAK